LHLRLTREEQPREHKPVGGLDVLVVDLVLLEVLVVARVVNDVLQDFAQLEDEREQHADAHAEPVLDRTALLKWNQDEFTRDLTGFLGWNDLLQLFLGEVLLVDVLLQVVLHVREVARHESVLLLNVFKEFLLPLDDQGGIVPNLGQ